MEPPLDRDIRIVIADDHALVREMLQVRLEQEPRMTVVGLAHDGEEAVRLAFEENPDILLMDIVMPGVGAFDAVRRISSRQADVRLIFFSACARDCYIEEALDVGASGYVCKEASTEHIVAAIEEVSAGRVYFCEVVRDRMILGRHGPELRRRSRSRLATLTARERDVLRGIARGFPKKEIARMMYISLKTVDKHCSNLMGKLDIHDRVGLARYAIREELVEA